MFDYLQKFNKLPKDLREKVSSPSILTALSELETQYRVDLAMIVMKVMVKDLAVNDLPSYFISEFSFLPVTAEHLTRDLKERIFAPVAYYLDLMVEIRALDLDKDIDLIIKEAELTLSSANLISRFKNILSTYLRGVRNKIDTRNTLAKDMKIGGLNLSVPEIERVMKVCASHKFKNLDQSQAQSEKATAPVSRLDEIINKTEKTMASMASEYNLKNALAEGKVNVPLKSETKLDLKHEISAPKEILDLPSPAPAAARIPASTPALATAKAATPATAVAKAPVAASAAAPVAKAPIAPAKIPVAAAPTAKAPTVSAPVKGGVFGSIRSFLAKPEKAAPAKTPYIPVKAVAPSAAPSPAPLRTAARPAPAPSAAPRREMHDIRPVPKIMGPIEELQFFDLESFRRLGKTPAEATAKIFAKIKLLEKDGYDKMVAGIKAWRVSPVNRLYMRLGQEAVSRGMSLKDAVALRVKEGKEHLSQEEIDAIITLNGRLTF